LREPLIEHGSPDGWHDPSVSQRCVVVLQWLSQQSLLALHRSPAARQTEAKKQRPLRQSFEQQPPPEVQVSPTVLHPPLIVDWQVPLWQLSSQHSRLDMQVVPATLHSWPVAHCPLALQ
jgi:hypothetical protein